MVKVTFWDDFAALFADALKNNTFEYPLIIIVCCGRPQEWQKQINIANVTATTFDINLNHSIVAHMRRMLKQPEFEEYNKSFPQWKPIEILSIEQIKNVKAEHSEVVENQMHCLHCPRSVPYADKWFEIYCIASDATGTLPIVLGNFSAMKCFGKTAYEICDEENNVFPQIIRSLEKKEYTLKLLITIHNITGMKKVYTVKDMVPGHILKPIKSESEDNIPKPIQESFAEPSSSSYHLDDVSQNN
ncbi:hypothetical protein ACET3Z_021253 [Daucus carota]